MQQPEETQQLLEVRAGRTCVQWRGCVRVCVNEKYVAPACTEYICVLFSIFLHCCAKMRISLRL